MLAAIPLLALAYGTILGTIVIIARVDPAGLKAPSVWYRLWLVLSIYNYGHYKGKRRKMYAVLLPASSAVLCLSGAMLGPANQSPAGSVWYLLSSKLIAVAGAVFGLCGGVHNAMHMFIATGDRSWRQVPVRLILIAVSAVLYLAHMLALVGVLPTIAEW